MITAVAAWLCYPSANVLISESVHPSVRGYLGKRLRILILTQKRGLKHPNIRKSFSLSSLPWIYLRLILLPQGSFLRSSLPSACLSLISLDSCSTGEQCASSYHHRFTWKILIVLKIIMSWMVSHKVCCSAGIDGTCIVLCQRISVLARLQR